MIKITEIPAFKFLLITVLTMVAVRYMDLGLNTIILILGINLFLIILSVVKQSRNLLYFLIVISIGILLGFKVSKVNINAPDKILNETKALFEGKIIRIYNENENIIRFSAKGELNPKVLDPYRTKIMLTIFNTDERNVNYKEGDLISSNIFIRLPKEPIIPDEFPERQYMNSLGIDWIGRTDALNTGILSREKNIYNLRSNFINFLDKKINLLFSNKNSPIVKALFTGDKSGIEKSVRDNFAYAGTAHLLAVSGLHTLILSFIFYFLISFIKNKKFKLTAFIIIMLTFVIITGFTPSAVRAGGMIILYHLFKYLERPVHPLNVVSVVLLLAIIIDPYLIFSAGFQMSAFSVIGIIFSYKIFYEKLKKLNINNSTPGHYVINSISVTLSASILVMPLVGYYFNVVSFISPLSNLVIIPVFITGLIFAFLSLFFGLFWMDAAELYAFTSGFLFDISSKLNEFFISLPNSYFVGEEGILYALVISISLLVLFSSKSLKNFIFRFVFVSIISFLALSFQIQENKVQVYPRDQYVGIIDKTKSDSTLVFLVDRKPAQYPVADHAMINYLNNIPGSLTIAYNGNAGIKIMDKLNKKRNFKEVRLDHQILHKITNIYNFENKIFQLIEY